MGTVIDELEAKQKRIEVLESQLATARKQTTPAAQNAAPTNRAEAERAYNAIPNTGDAIADARARANFRKLHAKELGL